MITVTLTPWRYKQCDTIELKIDVRTSGGKLSYSKILPSDDMQSNFDRIMDEAKGIIKEKYMEGLIDVQ